MLTDEEILSLDQHKDWECECGKPHNCNDTSLRLYPYRNFICTTEDEVKNVAKRQAEENTITLVYPTDSGFTDGSLIKLAAKAIGYSGQINYYPSTALNDTYSILQIVTPNLSKQ
jgi:hypothetical protein